MNYRTSDVKTAKRGAEAHTIFMSERDGELQSTYFASTHGDAHLAERNATIQRLVNLHEGPPTAFSVDFMVDTWGPYGF